MLELIKIMAFAAFSTAYGAAAVYCSYTWSADDRQRARLAVGFAIIYALILVFVETDRRFP